MNVLSQKKVWKMQAMLIEGYPLRAIARALNISRGTVDRYAVRLQPERCPCGKPARHHGFCGHRYLKSSHHREFLAKLDADWVEPIRPAKPTHLRNIRIDYPYCIGGPSEGNALLMSVNAVVSKRLSDDARADICQDLLLSILEGGLRIGDLTPKMIQSRVNKYQPSSFDKSIVSLDAVRGHDGMEPLKLQDLIPADYDRTAELVL